MRAARPVRRAGRGNGPGRKAGTAPRLDPYTYIRTWEGWIYLAVVVDCFSRRVVGWAMADHLRTELPLTALRMALGNRRPTAGLIHHSDRGNIRPRLTPSCWRVMASTPA